MRPPDQIARSNTANVRAIKAAHVGDLIVGLVRMGQDIDAMKKKHEAKFGGGPFPRKLITSKNRL